MARRIFCSFVLSILLFLPAGFPPLTAASGEQTQQHSPLRLYIRGEPWERDLYVLDPTTLTTAPGPRLTIGSRHQLAPQQLVASADGSTLAAISTRLTTGVTHARDITIRIISAWSGMTRATFHPPAALAVEGLSTDGSQLFGYDAGPGGRNAEWYLLSTADGRTLSKFKITGRCCGAALDDAATHRLYVLQSAALHHSNQAPQPPTLVAYDLGSGREVAHTTLTGVVAGSGVVGQGNTAPEMLDWEPGFASSPDGRQLAVFDGESQTLLLIAADRLQIVRTEHVARSPGLLDRLGNLLGLLPEAALAKEWIGTAVDLQFSPDGRSLYAAGREGQVTGGAWSIRGLGLKRIDVASGQIVAQALPNQWVTDISVAPNGNALYTLSPSNPVGGGPDMLRRLDPLTLQTMTRRRVYDPPELFWLAVPVLGASDCRPVSPSRSTSMGIEVRGTGRDAHLWALVQASFPIRASHTAKIVWRMTGHGPFHIAAENARGTLIHPTSGPEAHLGSSWNRPGAEWGTVFTFPSPGCWEVHATRGKATGAIWFHVVPARQK